MALIWLFKYTIKKKCQSLFFADGPVDVNKLRHPLMTETTARFAHLLKTGDQMNDHHEHEQDEGVMSVEEAVAELADSVSVLLMAFDLSFFIIIIFILENCFDNFEFICSFERVLYFCRPWSKQSSYTWKDHFDT